MEKLYKINKEANNKQNKWLRTSLITAFEEKIEGAPESFNEFEKVFYDIVDEENMVILCNEYNDYPTRTFIRGDQWPNKYFCYHSVADIMRNKYIEGYVPGRE